MSGSYNEVICVINPNETNTVFFDVVGWIFCAVISWAHFVLSITGKECCAVKVNCASCCAAVQTLHCSGFLALLCAAVRSAVLLCCVFCSAVLYAVCCCVLSALLWCAAGLQSAGSSIPSPILCSALLCSIKVLHQHSSIPSEGMQWHCWSCCSPPFRLGKLFCTYLLCSGLNLRQKDTCLPFSSAVKFHFYKTDVIYYLQ